MEQLQHYYSEKQTDFIYRDIKDVWLHFNCSAAAVPFFCVSLQHVLSNFICLYVLSFVLNFYERDKQLENWHEVFRFFKFKLNLNWAFCIEIRAESLLCVYSIMNYLTD